MLLGEVAPATKVVGEAEVGRAEVGRRHDDGRAAPEAPEYVVHASELVAAATGAALIEQRAAQASRVPPISEYVKVRIPTSATTIVERVALGLLDVGGRAQPPVLVVAIAPQPRAAAEPDAGDQQRQQEEQEQQRAHHGARTRRGDHWPVPLLDGSV